MTDPRFAQSAAGSTLPVKSIFGSPGLRPAAASAAPIPKQETTFEAVPGAFEELYGPPKKPTKEENMKRMFGTEDPVKQYFDSTPAARFAQGVTRMKEKTADRIQQYVEQHPEDADLLRPAPLSSWAKSIGVGLAKVPFRAARFLGKAIDTVDPTQWAIPDRLLKIPKVEDSVLQLAAAVGLPLEEAQQTAKEKPTLLQSLHDGFVVPVKEGFQIATMPNGPQKEEAFDAWAYKTAQAFTSGLTVGVVDQAVKENSVWLENGELMWRGVPIDQLTEMENKGVRVGNLTGQLGGSLVTYALVSPMLTAGLRNVAALDKVYQAHPYLASAIMTNAAEEGFESVIRKGTGQSYTFNDTLIGMMSGIAFETGKLAMGGYKLDVDPEAKPDVDVEAVRSFLNDEIRDYTIENGHVPDLNDLRSQIGDQKIPGTDMTVNELHTMLASSGLKENRLIGLKGGKEGRPGIDYGAEPPKPNGPDMEALIAKYGSEDNIPLHELDNVEYARVQGEVETKAAIDALTEAQQKYVPGGGSKEQFKANTELKSDPDAPRVIAESRGQWLPEKPEGEVATRYVHFDELHDIVKKGMLDPKAHGKAATPGTLGFDISPDGKAAMGAGLFNPKNGPLWKITTELDNVKNPSEIVLTGGNGIETSAPIGIDKLYIEGPGFDAKPEADMSVSADVPPARFSKSVKELNEGQADTGQVKQVFRTDKFNVDEVGEARLKQVQETLGLTTRDVRSWDDVEAMARDIGADPAQLMRRVADKTQLSDAEVEALRQNVASAHEFLANKYDLIDEANARGDKAAVAEIENKARVNEKIINDSVKKLIGGGTELGRGVAIYRKIAAMKMDDPTYWYKEAMSLIDDGRNKVRFGDQTVKVEDGQIPPELRAAIDSMMKSNDQVGLSYLMSQLKRTNNWDKAVHLWKAGLLTAPTTDLANILGNTTMMALETVKDVPATIMDTLISKGQQISNKLFGTEFDDSRVKTTTLRMQQKQLAGLYEGAGEAKEFFLTGIDPDDILGKYDVRGQVNYNSAILQGYTDAIFRKLGAEDLVFRYGFINKSLMESAQLRVKNMSNAEIEAAIRGIPEGRPQTKAELVRQFFLNPSDEATTRAINAAEYGTFQRDNPVSSAISGAKNATSPGGRATLEFIAPFTRTPTNIGMTIFDYTPVGFVTELAKQLKSPDRLRLVESFGRGVVGTSVMALGAALNKEGLMTGNAPDSEAERKLWEADRKQPNSIFIGGKWRKLDRVSPLGNLLTIGAEFNELGKTKTRMQQWTQIGFEGVKSVTEQSFLLGFSNALKAITEPDRFAETFAENAIRGMVPNIIARVGQGMDTYARDSGRLNPIAVLQERIPILREMLPEKLDVLGRKIKTQGGFLGVMFDPFSSKKPSSDPVIQELTRLKEPISAPNRALYSDEEYRALVDMRGRVLMQILGAAMEDDGYKALPDDGKREIINQLDTAVTREIHGAVRMGAAQRILEELDGMSQGDRSKRLEQIKKENSTVYTLIQILQSINGGN